MARLSVPSPWFVSALGAALILALVPALVPALALANGSKAEGVHLTEKQARDPGFVAGWLKTNASTADRKSADKFFEQGLRAKKSGNWSAAGKAFGESMLRFPDPRALVEYANADLRMLGQVRAREANPKSMLRDDMEYALGFYEAALAADGAVHSFSVQEREGVDKNLACLKRYLQTGEPRRDCAPSSYFSGEP